MLKKIMEKDTSEEWKEITLGDLVTFQRGHDLPSTKRIIGKYPVIASSGIDGYHNEYKAVGPGVIIGRSGKLGIVQLMEEDYWPLNTTLYSKEFHNADPKFVFFFLKTLNLETFNSGSAVPTLNRNFIHPLKIKIPGIQIQNKIGVILYDFDKQIKILTKQNNILEKIVQSIFKSWFVDFDGQTEFEDSELGNIPKGWKVLKFSDFVEISGGGTPKTFVKEFWGGNIKWVSIVDCGQRPFIVDTEKKITIKGVEQSSAKILSSKTLVVTARGTVGNFSLLSEPMAINQSCYGLTTNDLESQIFLFYLWGFYRNTFLSNTHGSVFDTITKSTFNNIKIVIPPQDLILRFEKIAELFFTQILKNQKTIVILTNMQDSLLPKLMSGEIKV